MNIEYIHVLSPLICLSINILSQIFLCRYASDFGLLRSVFSGFLLGLGTLICFEYGLYIFPFSSVLVNIIVYVALGYCYFHFINLGETARRIRLLRELYEAKEGLTLDEILRRYNAQEIVENRINRMISNHQIILKDGKLFIKSPILLFMARIMLFMKATLLK